MVAAGHAQWSGGKPLRAASPHAARPLLLRHPGAQAHKCPHHEQAHADGTRTVEHRRRHHGAMLGERQREVLVVVAALQDHRL
jgi:hypothetical protein